MRQGRRSWVRGAVVLGVAATMLAGALLTPALGTKSATTRYVKQKVRKVRKLAVTAFRTPDYWQSPSQLVAAGAQASIEGTCGGRHVVSGGVSHGASGGIVITESYPSDGNLGTPNVSGRNGWTVSVANLSSTPLSFFAYQICATTSASTGNVGGPARTTASSQKPGWRFTPLERAGSELMDS